MFLLPQATTPKSQGLTALSSYALTCLLFVFAAMMEFAVILYAMRKFKIKGPKTENDNKEDVDSVKFKTQKQQKQVKIQTLMLNNDHSAGSKGKEKDQKRGLESQLDLERFCYQTDQRAFFIFATAFTLFNALYAVYYVT